MRFKKIISIILIITLCVINAPLDNISAFEEQADPIKILFVGNSLTFYNDMPSIFKGIAEASDVTVETECLASGSYYLSYYANENNNYGAKYRSYLANNNYDYVILQAQSTELLRVYDSSSLPSATTLVDLARDAGATPILYMTWGLPEGYSFVTGTGDKYEYTYDTMTDALCDTYYKLGNELGVKVSPVGLNFRNYKNIYDEVDLICDDDKHPTFAGSYLAACTIYNTIFEDYDFPEEEKAYKSTCLGAPYWNSDEVNVADMDEITAGDLQMISDIRMSGSASNISLPTRGTSKYSANVYCSETNELYNEFWSEGDKITYSSSDENIASINENSGKITAANGGTALIKATSESGLSYVTTIGVNQPAKGITLSDESLTIVQGKTHNLTATITPEDTTNKTVTYESSDTTVATVDEEGIVTAIAPGICDITATTHNGFTATCSVIVKLNKITDLTIKKQTASKGNAYTNYVLNWSAITNAQKYIVYRSTTEDSGFEKVATVKTNTFTDVNLPRGTRYYYKVYASVGVLAYRSSVSNIVNCKVPTRVTITKAIRTKASSKKYIKLTWDTQSDITGYKIYRATSKNGKYTLIKTITKSSKNTFTDKTAKKKKVYYYKIRAYVTIDKTKVFGQYSAKKKVKKA